MNYLPPCPKVFAAVIFASFAGTALAAPEIKISRQIPCNLFPLGNGVQFEASYSGLVSGDELRAVVADEAGKRIWENSQKVSGAQGQWHLAIGSLPFGYYELRIESEGSSHAERKASFGVAQFFDRSAKTVRDDNYKFGLKWWGGVTNSREDLTAMVKLGLQWTRLAQAKNGQLTTAEMLTDFPMNAVIKVERFPKELYDEQRYGPLAEWEAKYGKGAWTLKTVPKEQAYKAWLKEEIARIPKDQNVFEVWNEPWDKMSPEDFARICNWIAEVILKDRPDAIIGPNLLGQTSQYEYDARVIAAGGMKGMKMVALHPYQQSDDFLWMRDYQAWLKEKTGVDMEIYITEFGDHSTPQGPAKRTELQQAQRVVRNALSLYGEGVKAFMPHWLGQTENNPTYIEDWFGFLRKNEEPKPVLLAYANAARLIDGSKYLGDLWLGPNVGAMMFERAGISTLALWTSEEKGSDVEVEVGAPSIKFVDMMGRGNVLASTAGKVKLALTNSPVYLVGLGKSVTSQASLAARPDRWPKPDKPPRVERIAKKMPASPAMDGKFTDWQGAAQVGLMNAKVNPETDCSGFGYLSWDDSYLYVGVQVRDNEMLNNKPRAKLYLQDSVELFVSTMPRVTDRGFGPNDFQIFLTPASGEGKPILGVVTDREAGTVVDLKNVRFFGGKIEKGWAVQAAIPWSELGGVNPRPGLPLCVEMRLNDADTSHERFKIDPIDTTTVFRVTDPTTWATLKLVE